MAYDTQKLYDQAIKAIDENNLYFVEDVVAYMGISKTTFYEHFPAESNEMNDIKDALSQKRAETKVSLRKKLHNSTAPAALLGLYKLLATDEERRALAMEYREHSGEMKISKIERRIVDPKDE